MEKAEDYLESPMVYYTTITFNGDKYVSKDRIISIIKQAQLDAIEYAVNKCEENAELDYWKGSCSECQSDKINYDSILKTIDQIKEELK